MPGSCDCHWNAVRIWSYWRSKRTARDLLFRSGGNFLRNEKASYHLQHLFYLRLDGYSCGIFAGNGIFHASYGGFSDRSMSVSGSLDFYSIFQIPLPDRTLYILSNFLDHYSGSSSALLLQATEKVSESKCCGNIDEIGKYVPIDLQCRRLHYCREVCGK